MSYEAPVGDQRFGVEPVQVVRSGPGWSGSTNAPYTIAHNDGEETKRVD